MRTVYTNDYWKRRVGFSLGGDFEGLRPAYGVILKGRA